MDNTRGQALKRWFASVAIPVHVGSMVNPTPIQARFLRSFAKHGVVGPAIREADIERATLDTWRQDEEFEALMAQALEEAVDEAEVELRRRAVHGTVRLLFHQGSPIWKRDPTTGEVLTDDNFDPIAYTENERSDALLQFYLKANRAKYADKSKVELGGPGGAPLQVITQYVLPNGKTEADYDAAASHLRPTEAG